MPKQAYDNDEAVARALQRQYERDARQRQSSRHSGVRRGGDGRSRPTPSAPREEIVRRRTIPIPSSSDEEYARQIAEEEERLYAYQRQAGSAAAYEVKPVRNLGDAGFTVVVEKGGRSLCSLRSGADETPPTSRESSENEDTEYARRVEQELHDEELARRMESIDEDRISRNAARQVAAAAPEPRPCTRSRIFRHVVFFSFLAAIAVAFIYLFFINDSDLPRWVWDPEEFADEDPFDAVSPEDSTPWRRNGRGLTADVINALDDEWYPFFYEAILDWDNGYPDSLTLSTSTDVPDPACKMVPGKVKVCNGDYGSTSWKGINEVHIDGSGYIYSSTARLNDFYFDGNSDSMQYTMCHELGHAWGLPHTDEIFGNADLGNCMDYTHNEGDSKRPDISNYDFLFELYGLVPGAEAYDPPTAAPTVAPAPTPAPFEALSGTSSQAESETGNDGNRALEEIYDDEAELKASMQDARERIMSGNLEGVRVLYKGSYGEVHETSMKNGHKLRVQKLLVPDNA